MAVIIGHASLNEYGRVNGGQPGDQTGGEVFTKEWYSKPWTVVLRPRSAVVAEKSAQACEAGCNNRYLGYDQLTRNTAHDEAKKVGYDLSKIKTPCNTDCSAFMTLCAIAGGVKALEYTGNAPTTSTMQAAFSKTGQYEVLTDSRYLTMDAYLRRGDILVAPGKHTAMVLSDGINVAKPTLSYPLKGIDISVYQDSGKINHQSMKALGVKTVVIKALGKNNQVDRFFEQHYNSFNNAGIPIDVYQYSYARNCDQAASEAKAMIALLNGRAVNTVYLDVEDGSLPQGETLVHCINTYVSLIQAAGYKVAVYCGLSFLRDRIAPYKDIALCRQIWIARYPNIYTNVQFQTEITDEYKPVIDGFDTIGWQYTSSGKMPSGYSGNKLDFDIFYKEVGKNKFLSSSKAIKTVKVNANSLRVRKSPVDGETVEYVGMGQKLFVYDIDKTSGWYRVGPNMWVGTQYVLDA